MQCDDFWEAVLHCVNFCVCVFLYGDYDMTLSYLLHVRYSHPFDVLYGIWDFKFHRFHRFQMSLCVPLDRQLLLCSTRFRILLLDFNELAALGKRQAERRSRVIE